jgi:hypothetical protein
VPIGIHYTKHAFRADLQLVVGEVLDASKYRGDYKTNAPKTVNVLTEVMEEIFRNVVLYVEQNERSLILEQQLEMLRNENARKFSIEVFRKQKDLCETVSMMDDKRSNEQKQLQDNYFSQLSYHELNDSCFTGGTKNSVPLFVLYWDSLCLRQEFVEFHSIFSENMAMLPVLIFTPCWWPCLHLNDMVIFG